MKFYAVKVEAEATRDGELLWSETTWPHLDHLEYDDAVVLAGIEADRLRAHWGHVRVTRRGRGSWHVYEPGEVDGWVRVVEHPDYAEGLLP